MLLFWTAPVFAQRGGHAGGFGGGRFSGEHFSGGHSARAHSFGAGRSSEGMRAEPRGGIAVYSGDRARGESRQMWSHGRASRFSSAYTREFATPTRQGHGTSLGSDQFAEPRTPLHTTIGFPPDRRSAHRRISERRAGRGPLGNSSGAPLEFAGQGNAIWAVSPGRSASRGSAPGRASGRKQAPNSRPAGEWHGRRARSGRWGGSFPRRYRGRNFFNGGGFGLFDYGFYGYGLGLYFPCGESLGFEWGWGSDSLDCQDFESQAPLIQSYGADQPLVMPAGSSQEYEPNASQNPPKAGASANAFAAQAKPKPDTLIYLADGTVYAATQYWLAGGDLHYITSYGADDSVPIGRINLQRTVDANSARGVAFTLRSAPGAAVSRPSDGSQ